MPCHPGRARLLLKRKKAARLHQQPFQIVLHHAVEQPGLQPVELRIDPGSKTTGLSLVAYLGEGWRVLWVANLHHRGQQVKAALDKRRAARRSRRSRQTRYRQPRFNNRKREEGWLAPSLRSRVENVFTWASRLTKFAPVGSIAVETVRFDTHKLTNPEVEGVLYQQGTLFGFEVRQYLLEKWDRRCAYCDASGVPLQVEHILARSKGGTDRVSNLTLSCTRCNSAKGQGDIRDFLAHDPTRLKQILAQARQSLKDAAAINSIRYAIGNQLKCLGLPVSFWSGGRTKYNRLQAGYAKDHWIDASCVGEQPAVIPVGLQPLTIQATGRGSRQACRMDKFGFPRTSAKLRQKRVHGFQSGDLVQAVVPTGKKAGVHTGRVAIRASGSFRVGNVDGINYRYCRLLQRADGYEYLVSWKATSSVPAAWLGET